MGSLKDPRGVIGIFLCDFAVHCEFPRIGDMSPNAALGLSIQGDEVPEGVDVRGAVEGAVSPHLIEESVGFLQVIPVTHPIGVRAPVNISTESRGVSINSEPVVVGSVVVNKPLKVYSPLTDLVSRRVEGLRLGVVPSHGTDVYIWCHNKYKM